MRMGLETTLADIIARLRRGRFPNEQAVSQGIVLRVLQGLGWDIYDTTSVWPEFQTGEGRADFALCYPPSKPAEFIEVKPPGKAEDRRMCKLDLFERPLTQTAETPHRYYTFRYGAI